jgi:hypothetical protein
MRLRRKCAWWCAVECEPAEQSSYACAVSAIAWWTPSLLTGTSDAGERSSRNRKTAAYAVMMRTESWPYRSSCSGWKSLTTIFNTCIALLKHSV